MDTSKPVRKRANTRQRLLDAAVDVFIAKGFAGTRIDDVVKKAGFTRGAFYSNYSSLDELLQEALVNRKMEFMKELGEKIAGVPPSHGIGAMVQVLESLRPAGRTLYIFHTEVLLYRMRNPESAAFANVIMADIHEELGEIISSALTQLGRRPTIGAANIADLLSAIFFDSLAREQAGLTPDDQKHILAELIEAVVYRFSEPIGRVGGDHHGGCGPGQGAEHSSTDAGDHAPSMDG